MDTGRCPLGSLAAVRLVHERREVVIARSHGTLPWPDKHTESLLQTERTSHLAERRLLLPRPEVSQLAADRIDRALTPGREIHRLRA